MNATSRYILTASTVAAGLFVVGATANAIVSSSDPQANAIGEPAVVPSEAADATSDSTLVEVPMPSPSDLVTSPILDAGGWATSPGSPGGDDDGDDSDDDHGDDGPEDESENESEDD